MVDMLRQFGMQDNKPIQTPMETNMKFGAASDGNVIANVKMYQQMFGKLNYLTIRRPDMLFQLELLVGTCKSQSRCIWW